MLNIKRFLADDWFRMECCEDIMLRFKDPHISINYPSCYVQQEIRERSKVFESVFRLT